MHNSDIHSMLTASSQRPGQPNVEPYGNVFRHVGFIYYIHSIYLVYVYRHTRIADESCRVRVLGGGGEERSLREDKWIRVEREGEFL